MTNLITFIDGDQPNYSVIEQTSIEGICRVIVFERDEDTGARSVCNIFEMPITTLGVWIPNVCKQYEMNPMRDIMLPFEVDVGKATTLKGMAKKICEAAPLGFACDKAKRESEGGFVQHVNRTGETNYRISDWCDESTVASYENGREL